MNKEILAKLMELNNKKADKYLNKFANEIKDKISKSKDNDEIFDNLELLEEFVYKVPGQTLFVVKDVIENKKTNKVKIYKGGFRGKSYKDLVLESIVLLKKIRYKKLQEVFEILVFLYKSKDKQIESETSEAIKKIAEYDYYALKKIGYSAQRKVLDIILSWPENKKTENVEMIKIIAKELLKPSFEGTSMQDYKTMVFQSGSLSPTDFLKKIRRETINLVFSLYRKSEDLKTKIDMLEMLYIASEFPHHGDYGDKFEKMVIEDIVYLANEYDKIIFSEKKEIIASAPIVQEIERQLVWFNKNNPDKISKSNELLSRIRSDEFYGLYRILIGDTLRLDRIEKESWEEAEKEINMKIDSEFKKINRDTILEWEEKLNAIARYKDFISEWKLYKFNDFLFRMAKEKSNLAKILFDNALESNKPLKNFTGLFLFGFRQSGDVNLWDNYVERIIKDGDISLVKNIPDSFFYADLESIRTEDVELLSQIINKEKSFSFLAHVEKEELFKLNFNLIRVLIKIYQKDKKQIESLIMTLIRNDKEYLHVYIQELSFPTLKNMIDLSEWEKKNIKFISSKLIELKNLDYEAQILMLSIAKADFGSAMDVFIKRIRKRDKMREKRGEWISSIVYDAIPYDFNNELSEYINSRKEFIDIFWEWTKDMTKETSIYNMELAQLIQRVGDIVFRGVVRKMIAKSDVGSLKKATDLMWSVNSPDLDLCFEVIKKTESNRIWKAVGGIIFNTGVVSGEYGFVEAYERKIKMIEEYKTKGTKKEIRRLEKFKKEIIKDLRQTAKSAKQRADEDIKLRKLEFGDKG